MNDIRVEECGTFTHPLSGVGESTSTLLYAFLAVYLIQFRDCTTSGCVRVECVAQFSIAVDRVCGDSVRGILALDHDILHIIPHEGCICKEREARIDGREGRVHGCDNCDIPYRRT